MSTFATDNFFLISGFLMSYVFFKSMRSGGRFSLPNMYLRRYIRLTPCIAVVTLFVTVLFHRIGNGPLWKTSSPLLVRNCGDNWWANFLYIQNIWRPKNICLKYSWYLAADMQLFWISPIILYPLHRWPKYGFGVSSLLLLASVATPTVVVGFNYGYSVVTTNRGVRDSFYYYYIQSYTRAFPYLLGILFGYDIATKKRSRLTQVAVVVNWTVTCIIFILCCFAMRRLRNANIEYNSALEITCAALLRPLWSIAMVWIIYACTQGYGGEYRLITATIIVSSSSPQRMGCGCKILITANILTSRSAFLWHLFSAYSDKSLYYRMATSVTPGIFVGSQILDSYLGDLVLSIGVSGVITLFFDSPAILLEKLLKNSPPHRERVTRMQNVELCTEAAKDVRDGATPDA